MCFSCLKGSQGKEKVLKSYDFRTSRLSKNYDARIVGVGLLDDPAVKNSDF